MDDIFVGRLMSSPVRTVSPDTPVRTAAQELTENGIGSVVVVDGGNDLEGILTGTDFVRIVAEGHGTSDGTVEDYMTTDVITATASESLRDVADTMIEHGFHHVPVTEPTEGVIGMISTTDLTAYISHAQSPTPE